MATHTQTPALSDEQFQAIARALADPRRFSMLQQIARCRPGLACGTLAEHQDIGAPTISHHLKELAGAGLIRLERAGRGSTISFERKVWQAYLRRLRLL